MAFPGISLIYIIYFLYFIMVETPQTPAEPVYPDMPEGMTYMKELVWKSHKLDEVWIELKELKEKYAIRVAPDAPLELLTSPENLKIYEWVKRLPNNDKSLNMLNYAYEHEKIQYEFLRDMGSPGTPFYLELANKWRDGNWKQLTTETEDKYFEWMRKLEKKAAELKEMEKRVEAIKPELKTLTDQRDALKIECDTMKANAKAEIDKDEEFLNRKEEGVKSTFRNLLRDFLIGERVRIEFMNRDYNLETMECEVLGIDGDQLSVTSNSKNKAINVGHIFSIGKAGNLE